jgi:hypothetical protein
LINDQAGQIIGYRQGGEPDDERDHFYACPACGQMVDMRDLGQQVFTMRSRAISLFLKT